MSGSDPQNALAGSPLPAGVRPGTSGFTLLEAIVAISIVGMTVVTSLAAIGAQLRAGMHTRTALEVEALAMERMAHLQLVGAATLAVLPDSLRAGRFDAPFNGYAWSASVRPVREELDLYDAEVVITWQDGTYRLPARLYRAGAAKAP